MLIHARDPDPFQRRGSSMPLIHADEIATRRRQTSVH